MMRVMGRSVSELPALGLTPEANRLEEPEIPVARVGEGALPSARAAGAAEAI